VIYELLGETIYGEDRAEVEAISCNNELEPDMLVGRGLLREICPDELVRLGEDVWTYVAVVGVCLTDSEGRGIREGVADVVLYVW
jgi:hypothetical protein